MTNKPTNKAKVGQVEIAEWTNNGKISYTIKKQYMNKTTNKWTDTGTYFDTDLDNLAQAIQEIRSGKKSD